MEIEQVVRELAVATPTLAVYALGGLLAVLRWQRHPRASMLALTALLILFLAYVGGIAARAAIVSMAQDGDFQNISGLFMLVGMAGGMAHALGIALLLVAAFAGRRDDAAE